MIELAVPQQLQAKHYTCGPASLLAAFRYLGVAGESSEESLAREMATSAKDGTTANAMIACAGRRWPAVELRENIGIDGLRGLVAEGALAIVLYQAWSDRLETVPYEDEFSQGHYSIVTAVSSRNAYLMDPSLRLRGRLTVRDLLSRWHELDDGRNLRQAAIVLPGFEPKSRPLGRTQRIS